MSGNAVHGFTWLPANLAALVKQSSGASAVQHTCAVCKILACAACMHALAGNHQELFT